MTEPLDLPGEVLDLAQFTPVEDLILAILREALPSIDCLSLIPDNVEATFVLVRRVPSFGQWTGDPRFVDVGRFAIHVYTTDPDGDEKGAVLSEAIRVALFNAWRSHKVIPGKGSIIKLRMVAEPVRKTDWATSSGPVQFADLPTGVWRYETQYTVEARKP
jgi:hypothetical protein